MDPQLKMVSLKGCGIVALSVVCLTLTTLVLHANAARTGAAAAASAPAGGNIYCATAFDKIRCEKVTKTATNWTEAMTMVLSDAVKHNENTIRQSKEEALGVTGCSETYTNIHARLKECLDLVGKEDRNDEINFKLAAAVTSLEDCKNALQDLRDDETPFYILNRHFNHALKICLAVDRSRKVEMYSRISRATDWVGKWDVDVLNDLFVVDDIPRILATPVSPSLRDTWQWKGDIKCLYTVKQGYHLLTKTMHVNSNLLARHMGCWCRLRSKEKKMPPPKSTKLLNRLRRSSPYQYNYCHQKNVTAEEKDASANRNRSGMNSMPSSS
nr:uncharacterized protein LOC109156039 [Ipomoea batatas]